MSNAFGGKKAGSVKSFGEKLYVKPGKYLFEVQAAKVKDSDSGLYGIAELKVVESEATEGTPPCIPGTIPSLVEGDCWNPKTGDMSFGRFVTFLNAVSGQKLTDDEIDEAVSKHNPLAFLLVRCVAYTHTKTRPDGSTKDYTNFRWETVPEEEQPTPEEQDAKRLKHGMIALGAIEAAKAADAAAAEAAELAEAEAKIAAAKLKAKK